MTTVNYIFTPDYYYEEPDHKSGNVILLSKFK